MAWIEQVFCPPGHRSREKMEVRSRRRSALPSVGVAVRLHPRRHHRTRHLAILAQSWLVPREQPDLGRRPGMFHLWFTFYWMDETVHLKEQKPWVCHHDCKSVSR